MENMQLSVVAYYFTQPMMGNKIDNALGILTGAARSKPENIIYEFLHSMEDGDRFVIVKTYCCVQGLEPHRQTRHFQRIGIGITIPLLEHKEMKSFHISPDEPRR